jgi:hypothetical protein
MTDIFANQPDITVEAIDYASPDDIAEVLKTNNIDTVISITGMHSEEHLQSQFNLIDAAVKSGTVKRFAPSEFAADNAEAVRRRVRPLCVYLS